MMIEITFKTPDALNNALDNTAEEHRDRVKEVLEKFIKWGEYVKIEFDIEAGTATVRQVCQTV